MDPRPISLFDVVKRAADIVDPDDDDAIVGDFERHLKIPTVMMGFGLPDDNIHAPNEKFHIANFYRGIESIIVFFETLAK